MNISEQLYPEDVRQIFETIFPSVSFPWGKGRQIKMSSPYRVDRHDSFSMDTSTGLWFDHGDSKSGDCVSMVSLVNGTDRGESIQIIEGILGRKLDGNGNKAPTRRPSPIPIVALATKPKPKEVRREMVCTCTYRDESGDPLFYKDRFHTFYDDGTEGKTFTQYRVIDGKQVFQLGDVRRVLYRLPDLITAPMDKPVWICAGEKDVDRLRAHGLLSVTNPEGEGPGKWKLEYSESLRGRSVYILEDNDEAGRNHCREVAGKLHPLCARVKIISLSGLPEKGDVSDWLDAGHTVEELLKFAESVPAWGPSGETIDSTDATEVIDWPEPEELQPSLPEVLKLDPRMVPACMWDYVGDVSERLQCPPDFVAAAVMGTLAGSINRRAMVQPKGADTSWTTPCNLWIALVGRPSSMKSPASEGPIRILTEIEREWTLEHSRQLQDYESEKKLDSIRKRIWEQNALKALKNDQTPEDVKLVAGEEPPMPKRLILGDASYEALHLRLSENPRGLLLYRDELSSLFASLDEEGRRVERGFLLETYTGKSQLKFDRIGRGVIDCPNATLSILGTIQPGRLRPILSGAINQGRNDDGLSQRFLYVWPDPTEGFRYIDRPIDVEAENQLSRAIKILSHWDPTEIPVFRLDEKAQILFQEWYEGLMREARSEDIHPAVESFMVKLPKPVCSIAIILELFERSSSGRELDNPQTVNYRNMARACCWADYLLSHARRAYYHLTRQEIVGASILGEKILHRQIGKEGTFTAREVYRKEWSILNDPEKVTAACQELIFAGWIRQLPNSPSGNGGRRSEKYEINPKVISKSFSVGLSGFQGNEVNHDDE